MADSIFGQGLNPEPVINVPAAGDAQFDNRGKVIVPKPVHIVNLTLAGNAAVAALSPLPTAGNSTVAQIEAKINSIIAALKA